MEQKASIAELKAKDEFSKNELHKEAQTAGAIGGAVMQDRKADTLHLQRKRWNSRPRSLPANGSLEKATRRVGQICRRHLQRSFDPAGNWQMFR